MSETKKILIATTNEGKFIEIKHFLGDLPYELLSLKDLDTKIEAPEETEDTIEGNAILKAKYYAEHTGMISMADDTGLFVDALDGWPGVHCSRVGKDQQERRSKLLEKMKGIENRTAHFRTALTLYDPDKDHTYIAYGDITGQILESEQGEHGYDYDPLIYIDEVGKTYAELTTTEKNGISHRGKALLRMKHFVQTYYAAQHIVVPVAIIIKDGKMLSAMRNDPHRPDYHRKWELPGGRMEFGEQMPDNLIREVKEETGYDIEIVKMLRHIQVDWHENLNYQVYLVPHVCKIIGGDGVYSDAEILEVEFVELDKIFDRDLIGKDPEMLQAIMPELKQVINEHNL